MKYCRSCGNQLEENVRFCGRCGTPITPAWQEVPGEPTVAVRHVVPAAATVQEFGDLTGEQLKPKKSKKGLKIVIAILSVVLVFALLAGLGYFVLRKETVYIKVESEEIMTMEDSPLSNLVIKYDYEEEFAEAATVYYMESEEVFLRYEYECDEKGNITEERRYYEDGTLQRIYKVSYDEEDNLVDVKETWYDENKDPTYVWNYDFEYEDDVIIIYEDNGYYVEWITDDHGNVVKEIKYDANDQVVHTAECEYDEHGNQIEQVYIDSEGEEYFQINSTYEAIRVPRKNWNFSEINFMEEINATIQEITGK